MAVRFSGSQSLTRTANVPVFGAYTFCGWGRLVTDTNSYATLVTLETSGSDYMAFQTDSNGTDLKVWQNNGMGYTATLVALTANVDFFWAITASGTGAGNGTAYYRAATAAAFTSQTFAGSALTSARFMVGNDSIAEPWNGRIWNVKVWDRALTAAELLIESHYRRVMFPSSRNLHWMLNNSADVFDYSGNARAPTVSGTLTTEDGVHGLWTPSRKIFLPTSSTQSFSYAAVGGLTLGGASPALRVRTKEAAGGATLGGTAVQARVSIKPVAGGIQLGGAAAFAKGQTIVPTGGVVLDGTAPQLRTRVAVPAGGLNLGGEADYENSSGTQSYSYSATGGISLAGLAEQIRKRVASGAGGIVLGGQAGYVTYTVGATARRGDRDGRRRGYVTQQSGRS